MFAEVGSQNDGNAILLGALFASEDVEGFPGYATNFGAGADYDQLFAKANGSPDEGEVRHLAAEAMQIAVDRVVAVVPIAGIDRIWGLRRDVEGFSPHPSAVSQKWSEVHAAA
jgi:ABC-type transport system substrate-binding protein